MPIHLHTLLNGISRSVQIIGGSLQISVTYKSYLPQEVSRIQKNISGWASTTQENNLKNKWKGFVQEVYFR